MIPLLVILNPVRKVAAVSEAVRALSFDEVPRDGGCHLLDAAARQSGSRCQFRDAVNRGAHAAILTIFPLADVGESCQKAAVSEAFTSPL